MQYLEYLIYIKKMQYIIFNVFFITIVKNIYIGSLTNIYY